MQLGEWVSLAEPTHHSRLTAGGLGQLDHGFGTRPAYPGLAFIACAMATPPSSSAEVNCYGPSSVWGIASLDDVGNYAHALPLEDEEVADDIDETLTLEGTVSRLRYLGHNG